ncbi:UvrD-helicase domain-containing protein [Sphingomonas endolithica]|uniref:UvrD-helicase domain-containing protein n=1 Tax=Sphingomonas endolithica TaxID=2972485 RepID=UPI003AADF6B4
MTSRIGSPDTQADIDVRACLDRKSPRSFVMVAGAGSGKTTSLIKALAHLGETRGADLRRAGQKIACITYTEVAVAEVSGDVGVSPLFHVSTIHSFLWSVIPPVQDRHRCLGRGADRGKDCREARALSKTPDPSEDEGAARTGDRRP